jgi:hypothetical protein
MCILVYSLSDILKMKGLSAKIFCTILVQLDSEKSIQGDC